jgi:hypothetical protein
LQKSLAALNELVGYLYAINIPWPLLRDGIPTITLDDETFVPTIARALSVFIDRITKLLNDDANGFTDKFIEKTEQKRKIDVKVHPSATGASQAFTRIEFDGVITLFFPKERTGYGARITEFGSDLEMALEGHSPADPAAKTKATGGSSATKSAPADDFISVSVSGNTITATSQEPTPFPSLSEIPRPDNLITQPPYYLMLKASSGDLYLEGHQPSVTLAYQYLTHHARNAGQMEMWLQPLAWGVAVSSLTISFSRPNQSRQTGMGPLILVALVEGVLGFEPIGTERGERGTWVWKRTRAFEGV